MASAADEHPDGVLRLLRDEAERLGFALAGVAPAEPAARADFLRTWLDAGRHGAMSYLARHVDQRADVGRFLPGAAAVICVADRHAASWPAGVDPEAGPPRGRIARYAWGDDYHRVMKRRLHRMADALRQRWPEARFRAAVDTAPVLEREHARRAGLGWIGKHTLLIHPRLGSWLLLGQIVTTLAITPDVVLPRAPTRAARGSEEPDHCGNCTRCIDACPTACIEPQGYRMDARRCISYLTIELRGPIEPQLHAAMGDWIAGCDVCQEVCPFNRHGSGGPALAAGRDRPGGPPFDLDPGHAPRPPAPALDLLAVLGWGPDDRAVAFRSSALKRVKLEPLKRNALIALGNHLARDPAPEPRRRIEQLAADPEAAPLLRLTARQVLDRLDGGAGPVGSRES